MGGSRVPVTPVSNPNPCGTLRLSIQQPECHAPAAHTYELTTAIGGCCFDFDVDFDVAVNSALVLALASASGTSYFY